jgi:hypothetical protein
MYAWIDIGTVVLLLVSSGGLWNIIRATVYRVTNDNEKFATVWTIWMLVMAALCGVFILAFQSYQPAPIDGPAGWAYFAMYYCGLVAVLTFGGLLLTGAAAIMERLTEIVRGE